MPDKLYVFTPSSNMLFGRCSYQVLEYASLSAYLSDESFVEDGLVPNDAPIIGYNWLYTNRNGSPDQRFAQNRQIPVVQYTNVTLRSSNGMTVEFQVSSPIAAEKFVHLINSRANVKPPVVVW